jgi:hypothetical protein
MEHTVQWTQKIDAGKKEDAAASSAINCPLWGGSAAVTWQMPGSHVSGGVTLEYNNPQLNRW